MTTTPLCFVDTETTGVHPGRLPWEVAVIRRDVDGERTLLLQVRDVDLSNADPFGLKIGGFYERHQQYAAAPVTPKPLTGPPFTAEQLEDARTRTLERGVLTDEQTVAYEVEKITRGAHLVGVVPNFDAEVFDGLLRRHRLIPAWHYHLIDVEAMAVGWLNGRDSEREVPVAPLEPPWRSDELSLLCGVEPPSEEDRHTALGDARWAMRWYDAMTSGAR